MSISKISKQRWLSLALLPLFSVAVLAGCSSDDDDTTPAVTEMEGEGTEGEGTEGEGTEGEGTEGEGTEGEGTEGEGTEGEGTEGEGTEGEGTEGEGTEGEGTETVDQTGPLNEIPLGASIAALSWDGSALSGQIDVADGVSPAGAALYTGISAAGNGQQAVTLNGDGNPTYFVPTGLAADQAALISDNITSGNLFVRLDLADGGSQNGIILIPGVEPKFASLSAANSVPAGEAFSNGQGFINLNTVTGEYSAVINVSLNGSDVDADEVPQTITAAHIHSGGSAENGPVIVEFADAGDGRTWTAMGTLSTADLASVLDGNSYFNVHGTDGSGFLRGQIPGSN